MRMCVHVRMFGVFAANDCEQFNCDCAASINYHGKVTAAQTHTHAHTYTHTRQMRSQQRQQQQNSKAFSQTISNP